MTFALTTKFSFIGKEKQWKGPYKLTDSHGKLVTVESEGKQGPFSLDKVRPLLKDDFEADNKGVARNNTSEHNGQHNDEENPESVRTHNNKDLGIQNDNRFSANEQGTHRE